MDKDKIGDFIKELRQNSNMSQNDLAEIIPIPGTLNKVK